MTRTLIFKSVKDLEEKIDGYWDYCEANEKPMTYTGLAYHLGITRQTLHNYNKKDEYAPILERAKARIEMDTEERLHTMGTPTTGLIFTLKNNFNWNDDKKIQATVESNNKNYDFSHLSTEEIKELLRNEE